MAQDYEHCSGCGHPISPNGDVIVYGEKTRPAVIHVQGASADEQLNAFGGEDRRFSVVDPEELKPKSVKLPVHLAVEMVPTFSHTHFSDVKAFHQKFGLLVHEQPVHLTKRKLGERIQFLKEELDEFAAASGYSLTKRLGIYELDAGFDQDLAQQADALIDLVYVAIGTAVQLGLPWQELWDDVQRANMSKVRGETKRGHKVDVTKPEGWVGPTTHQILNRHGYNRADYIDFDGTVDEELCHDDQ